MASQEGDTASAPAAPAPDAGPAPAEQQPEASLLVSEFPPPPFYYRQAAALPPPPIPADALARGTRRAAAAAARARAEAERNRLALDEVDKTDAILGGVAEPKEEEERGRRGGGVWGDCRRSLVGGAFG